MSRSRQILMAGGTFSAAMAIGLVMLNGDALAAKFTSDEVAEQTPNIQIEQIPELAQVQTASVLSAPTGQQDDAVALDGPVLEQPQIEEQAPAILADFAPVEVSEPVTAPVQLAALDTEAPMADVSADAVASVPTEVAPTLACNLLLEAKAMPAAMVDLTLDAPCQANARATIHHQGMIFTTITDDDGGFEIMVPALAQGAVFIVAFDDGEGAMANTEVPDLARYDRAVLQWQGDIDVALHAFERGAHFGGPGHVWMNAAGSMEGVVRGEGGYIMRLGFEGTTNPFMAEVYTFPTATVSNEGTVELSVEAEITASNCGRDVAAQSLQVTSEEGIETLDLEMTMPDCDAVGDYIVLNNMLQDLTLAAK